MTAIKLNEVRKEFKSVNIATVGNVLSVIYSLVNEYKEKQKELSEEQANNLQYLTKILPQSKTQAKKHIAEIEKYGNVNGKRIVKTKDGETKEYTIRPSVDMVLRYFVAEYNKNIPEAQLKKHNASCKKHESKQATAKPIECKVENKQTANTMK
jgi:DNA-directed RNA polymerase subunit F